MAAARLLIRTGRTATRRGTPTDLKAWWHRLVDGAAPATPSTDAVSLEVEVAAEPGGRLFVLRDPEGTIDVSIAPGNYDITAVRGSRLRRYTVTLGPGATFDLNLQDAMQPP